MAANSYWKARRDYLGNSELSRGRKSQRYIEERREKKAKAAALEDSPCATGSRENGGFGASWGQRQKSRKRRRVAAAHIRRR
jgi:hypothetical protein